MTDFFDSIVQAFIDVTSWACEGRTRRQVIMIVFASLVLLIAAVAVAIYLTGQ